MNDNMTAADIFTPRYTPFDWDFGTAGMEDDAYDDDDFDPNECPECGQDIVFGVCINSECMWRPEDDDTESEVDHE